MFYIWHKEAKTTKFPIIQDNPLYYVASDGALYLKREYEPCDPPTSWADVTSLLTLSVDSNVLVLDGFGAVWARTALDVSRRLRLVDAYQVADLPASARCLHVPFQRMIVLEEERPIQS